VVILQENVAFDHYFGTYPNATNPLNEPKFAGNPHTPSINGLTWAGLLTNNNTNSAHPFRLERVTIITPMQLNRGI
jgi:phospholipase C